MASNGAEKTVKTETETVNPQDYACVFILSTTLGRCYQCGKTRAAHETKSKRPAAPARPWFSKGGVR